MKKFITYNELPDPKDMALDYLKKSVRRKYVFFGPYILEWEERNANTVTSYRVEWDYKPSNEDIIEAIDNKIE